MNAPFHGFPPELLAKMAQGAFRPPQPMMGGMQAPGVPGMQMPQGGDGGLGQGLAGLGAGLASWRPGGSPMGADMNTQAPAFGGGLNSSGRDVLGDAHKQWLTQNAGDPSISGYGPSASSGSFGNWLRGLF